MDEQDTTPTATGDAGDAGPEPLSAETSTPDRPLPGAADPAEPAPGDSADQERWAALTQRLDHLERLLTSGFAAAQKRDTILDTLHRENQAHQRNLLHSATEPLLLDLIKLHDLMVETISRAATEPEKMDRTKLLADIEFHRDELLETLNRYGVDGFADEPGVPFDGYRQEIIRIIPVADPAENARVQVVVKPGFARRPEPASASVAGAPPKQRILRRMLVAVGKHQPPPEPPRANPAVESHSSANEEGERREP